MTLLPMHLILTIVTSNPGKPSGCCGIPSILVQPIPQIQRSLKWKWARIIPCWEKGYGELASDSRSQHRSQRFGRARERGSQMEYFKTIKGTRPVNSLMDGINTTWNRFRLIPFKNQRKLSNDSTTVMSAKGVGFIYDENNPQPAIKQAFEMRSWLQKNINENADPLAVQWCRYKLKEADELILANVWSMGGSSSPEI